MSLAYHFTAGLEVHVFCHPGSWHLITAGLFYISEIGWKLAFQGIAFSFDFESTGSF